MHSLQRFGIQIVRNPVRLITCVVAYVGLRPYGYIFGGILRVATPWRPWFAFSVCIAIVLLMNWLIPKFWRFVIASVSVKWFFLHYAADRTVVVSHVEAMMSAGNYDSAATELDALLGKHGAEAEVCRVGLNLHLGQFGSRERGEALLRRMRNENPAQYERMATQRLIDIYMTHPETHRKALTELRRLAAKFPNTPEAAGALRCIEEIRAHHSADSDWVYEGGAGSSATVQSNEEIVQRVVKSRPGVSRVSNDAEFALYQRNNGNEETVGHVWRGPS